MLQAMALCAVVGLAGCIGDDRDEASADRVSFEAPIELTQAQVLGGDPSDGSCPEGSGPCFKDNPDILAGQRTLADVSDLQVTFLSRWRLAPSDTYVNEYHVATLLTRNSKFDQATVVEASRDSGNTYVPVRMTTVGARLSGAKQQLVRLETFQPSEDPRHYRVSVTGDGIDGALTLPHLGTSPDDLWATAADFDDDGVDEIAYVAGNYVGLLSSKLGTTPASTMKFATALGIAPTKALTTATLLDASRSVVAAVIDESKLKLAFFSVDPKTRALRYLSDRTLVVGLPAGHAAVPDTVRLVAGHFTDPSYDQLALAFDELDAAGSPVGVSLVVVDRQSDGSLRQTLKSQVLGVATASRQLLLDKGRLLYTDPYEGLVVLQDRGDDASRVMTISLVDVTDTRTPTLVSSMSSGAPICSFAMATGNFDRQGPERLNQPTANRNLQVAFVRGENCRGGVSNQFYAGIVPISPGGGALDAPRAVINAPGDLDTELQRINTESVPDPVTALSMTVLDTNGRSLVLGRPSIVTISDLVQPTVVVAAPPMQADWVPGTDGQPQFVNMSMGPRGFWASYSDSTSQDANSTTKATSTWSFAATETVDAKFTVGDCETGDCEYVGNKTSATQALDGSTAAYTGRMSTSGTQISQRTDADDFVWYRQSNLTIYVYPVVGRTTCPLTKPTGCSDSELVPLTLLVAGPDTVRRAAADARLLSWYQPPWVPGQLLSYPATVGQLRTAAQLAPEAMKTLSQGQPTAWALDSTQVEQKVTWGSAVQEGQAVESNGNFSGDSTTTVGGKVTVLDAATISGSLSLSVGGSRGFKNLTDSDVTMSKTSGLSLYKDLDVDDPARFSYDFAPYVFAEQTPGGALSADDGSVGYGAIRSGFVVDLNTNGGRPRQFWTDKYPASGSAVDLALLHPLRRQVYSASAPTKDEIDRCIGVGGGYDCVREAGGQQDDPLHDERHRMRGFFISEAGAAAGQGPLKTSATVGESVTLQARVHNLSRATMPAGTRIRAAFHGLVVDANSQVTGEFAIGEPVVVTTLIPPYHTDDDQPNWALVSQTFDTTGHENQTLCFWVVVWMEDANGVLVTEPVRRGLTGTPGATTRYADALAMEDEHGNNVGVFDLAFHVFPKASVSAGPPAAATRPSLKITAVGREAASTPRGVSTLIAVRVDVGEHDLPNGATVAFYDGDPTSGATLVGLQQRPFLRANTTYDLRVPFRSNVCRTHDLQVVVAPGTRFEHRVRMRPIEVSCS